jgi:hypothetical protein
LSDPAALGARVSIGDTINAVISVELLAVDLVPHSLEQSRRPGEESVVGVENGFFD